MGLLFRILRFGGYWLVLRRNHAMREARKLSRMRISGNLQQAKRLR
jgi:hypothetical protein